MKHRQDRKQSQQVTWQVLRELCNESPHLFFFFLVLSYKEAGSSLRVGWDRVNSSSNVVKTLLNSSSRAILPSPSLSNGIIVGVWGGGETIKGEMPS